jgi:transcription antitermination factor NusG
MADESMAAGTAVSMDAKWYVINTYSGHENKARTNLEHRIQSLNQSSYFESIVVPTEHVVETKGGEKIQLEKRIFPGYLLVKMILTDDSWSLVKNGGEAKGQGRVCHRRSGQGGQRTAERLHG